MGFVFVALGGAVGAMGRYAISLVPVKTGFPILTLITNILGAVFDKEMKYTEGRKINKEFCVEKPDSLSIHRVCTELLGLKCKFEYKSHPKDWQKKGRVIVQIKDNEGKFIKEDIKTSKI